MIIANIDVLIHTYMRINRDAGAILGQGGNRNKRAPNNIGSSLRQRLSWAAF